MIQLVLTPFGAFPLWKTSTFLYPTIVPLDSIMSALEGFQYPSPASLYGRVLFLYFSFLGVKKYHSSFPSYFLFASVNHPKCYIYTAYTRMKKLHSKNLKSKNFFTRVVLHQAYCTITSPILKQKSIIVMHRAH